MSSTSGAPDHLLVNAWLAALGRRAGLALKLDADGVCAIGHASQLDCALEVPDGAGTVYLRVPLMPWRDGEHPHLAAWCLSEHFLGLATGGASFAIDRDEGELVLWLSRPLAALDEQAFAALVVGFLDQAATCRERLEGACRDPGSAQAPRGIETLTERA